MCVESVPCRNVMFLFWSVTPPTANFYPLVFRHRGLPDGRKIQRFASTEANKPTKSDSARSKKPLHPSKKLCDHLNFKLRINQLINLQCKARLSCYMFSKLATSVNERRVWMEREKQHQYFELGLQYPF